MVISRFGEVAQHSGFYAFQNCALCREVSHHELFAKIPSLPLVLHLRYYIGHYPRFMTIGKDRNKDQFQNWQLYSVWKLPFCDHRAIKLPFCDHRAIKLTQNCIYLTNPCYQSVFRHSWISCQDTNFFTCYSVLPLAPYTALCFWRDTIPRRSSAGVHSCSVSRSRKPT